MNSVLLSRIHTPGCVWAFTMDCEEQLQMLHSSDAEAYDHLMALRRRATRSGLPPSANNSNDARDRSPTHRCPVGTRVPTDIPDHGFGDARPLPWTGELYAESTDCATLHRLYFIEGRPSWAAATDRVIASGLGSKPSGHPADWNPFMQTRQIYYAMESGVTSCENRHSAWRRWDDA